MELVGPDRAADGPVWGPLWLHAAAGHVIAPSTYLGLPLLIILIWLAVVSWSNRLVRLLVLMFVVIIGPFAAGPNLIFGGNHLFSLPWGGLWTLPFFRSAEPIRLVLFAYLVFSIVLALWLARLVTTSETAG